jgi:predicted dehydrogenase
MDSKPEQNSRRTFLSRRAMIGGSIASLGAFTIVPRHVLGGPGFEPPSAKINLAGVGIGGVGNGQLRACAQAGFNIVALCDVDDVMARPVFERHPEARRYRDFREMLDKEADKIDAVYCGTPDHSHAMITMAALRRKKHVCCVKPMTRTLAECKAVVDAAKQAGTATQVTAQPNTSDQACRTCELIWAGAIGDVREVHVWTDRPLWPQGMARPDGRDEPRSTFDWNLWLGPMAERPFKDKWADGDLALRQIKARPDWTQGNRGVYHPFNFRGWWDFGSGALGDMGCHHINAVYRALKLKQPESIQATSTVVLEESAPLASIVTYDYGAREGMPPVRVVWYDGGLKPPAPREMEDRPLPAEGVLYIGDKGKMLRNRILPESQAKKAESIPQTLARRSGTWGEWMEACKGGERAGCHFEWAGLLTDFVLLGNAAIRTGKRLAWDAEARRFTNAAEANNYIRAPYRSGWEL